MALCLWVRNSLSVPQSLKMKAPRSFETSRHFNPAPRRRTGIPEPSAFWTHMGGDCLRELRNYWHRKKDSKTVVMISQLRVCPNNNLLLSASVSADTTDTGQFQRSKRQAHAQWRDWNSPKLRDFCWVTNQYLLIYCVSIFRTDVTSGHTTHTHTHTHIPHTHTTHTHTHTHTQTYKKSVRTFWNKSSCCVLIPYTFTLLYTHTWPPT